MSDLDTFVCNDCGDEKPVVGSLMISFGIVHYEGDTEQISGRRFCEDCRPEVGA